MALQNRQKAWLKSTNATKTAEDLDTYHRPVLTYMKSESPVLQRNKILILLRSHKVLKKRLKRRRRAEKRLSRKKEDNKALERYSSPTGINCLAEGVRIHA